MLSPCTDTPPSVSKLGLEPGSSGLSLRANFTWTLAGNVVYAACQWGMLMVLAKLGTPEMVGQFALSLAIVSPILISAGLCLRNIQATDAVSEHSFSDYLSLRLLTTLLALLAVAGVLFFSGYGRQAAAVILVVALAKGCEAVSDIFYGLLQQRDRMDRIAVSMMIKGVLSLAAMGLGVFFGGGLLPGVCGLLAVWALVLVAYDARCGASILGSSSDLDLRSSTVPAQSLFQPRWNPTALFQLVLLALPVGIAMALVTFNANIPRYFIEHHLGTRDLGLFAAMAYPMVAGSTIVAAMGQSAMPRLARFYATSDRRAFSGLLTKILWIALAVGASGALLIGLAGRPILLLLYQAEYASAVNVFFWLGITTAIGFVASLLGYAMNAVRQFRAQTGVFVIVTLVTIAASAVLVPRYQLLGAAFAIMVATTVQAAASAAVVCYALRENRKP